MEVSLLGVGTVLRLERDACPMVKVLRPATNGYAPAPPNTPASPSPPLLLRRRRDISPMKVTSDRISLFTKSLKFPTKVLSGMSQLMRSMLNLKHKRKNDKKRQNIRQEATDQRRKQQYAGQDKTGQNTTEQDRTRQDRVGQNRVGQDRVRQDRVGQDRVGQDTTGHDFKSSDSGFPLYVDGMIGTGAAHCQIEKGVVIN